MNDIPDDKKKVDRNSDKNISPRRKSEKSQISYIDSLEDNSKLEPDTISPITNKDLCYEADDDQRSPNIVQPNKNISNNWQDDSSKEGRSPDNWKDQSLSNTIQGIIKGNNEIDDDNAKFDISKMTKRNQTKTRYNL